jgi:hypothetical protein
VVEGRHRVEQRLAQLKEQTAQWATRKDDALAEIEVLASQGAQAEEKAMLLAAQVEEQAQQLPELEDALRRRKPLDGPARQCGLGGHRSGAGGGRSRNIEEHRASSPSAAKRRRTTQRGAPMKPASQICNTAGRRGKPPKPPTRLHDCRNSASTR